MNYTIIILLFSAFTFVNANLDYLDDVKNFNLSFVMFVETKCLNCPIIEPHYKEAGRLSSPVVFVTIDCDEEKHKKNCKEAQIEFFPEFVVYRFGRRGQIYMGPTDSQSMVNFLKPQVKPNAIELISLDNLEEFLKKKKDGTFVGGFQINNELKTVYLDLAKELKNDFKGGFTYSSDIEVLKKLGTKNGVVFYPPDYQEKHLQPIVYTGAESKDEMKNFLVKNIKSLNRDPSDPSGLDPSDPSADPKNGNNSGLKVKVLPILTMITTYVQFYL